MILAITKDTMSLFSEYTSESITFIIIIIILSTD